MKKIVILCCLLIGIISICFKDSVSIIETDSEEYSRFEIDSAIISAKMYFAMTFSDCDLLTIGYAGDQSIMEAKEWEGTDKTNRALIISCSFKTGPNSLDNGLEPEETYEGWKFIMFKRFGFLWFVKTNGYG